MAPPPSKPAAGLLSFLGPAFGGQGGKFFGIVSAYVDRMRAPGHSPLPQLTFGDWAWSALTLRHVWASSGTVWSLIALAMHFGAPIDMSLAAVAPLSAAYFGSRFVLWAAVILCYTAFWHVTTHVLGWATRPFIAARPYNVDKVAVVASPPSRAVPAFAHTPLPPGRAQHLLVAVRHRAVGGV